MRFLVLIISIYCAPAPFIMAQDRAARPFQVHANFAGPFLSVAGYAVADQSVDDITVNAWTPGVSAGYHINNHLYLGYSVFTPLNLTLKEEWGYNLDGNLVLDHETGLMHNIEARYTPFSFGLYLSVAYIYYEQSEYSLVIRRKAETIRLGANDYAVDLDATWNTKKVNRAGLGMGYYRLFKTGVSASVGVTIPRGFPEAENLNLVKINGGRVEILPGDFIQAETSIRDELFYGPMFLYLNVGFNFSLW